MRTLELFSGTGRMTATFKARGHEAKSVDSVFDADLKADVMTLTREDIVRLCDGEPDFIWASPPCQGFSVARIGKNWAQLAEGVYEPKSETARLGVALLNRTLEILSWFPDAKWCIENPRGMMRTLPQMAGKTRHTITFCHYGENRMKPTDIWTNLSVWEPQPPCKAGDPCHEAAPRGAKTGTQGIKNAYLRAALPQMLCDEVVEAAVLEHVYGRVGNLIEGQLNLFKEDTL